jgi:hypothetical protein
VHHRKNVVIPDEDVGSTSVCAAHHFLAPKF